MLCELCGKEVPRTRQSAIEGTLLDVCNDCAKFGTDAKSPGKKGTPIPISIRERLEARKRRLEQRDIYNQESMDLVGDYASMIKKARIAHGLSHDDLASRIMEKVSVIKKMESGQMRPTEGLRKKLEKALDINLLEKPSDIPQEYKSQKARPMTLGDLIKREE